MLIWAREEVGYSIEQAAEAIGVSIDALRAAENGEGSLTLNQLRRAAEKYDCPFGYFYLNKPPHKKSFQPVPDYRIEPGVMGIDHHRLKLEIKKVRDRRMVYIDLSESLGMEPKQFEQLRISDPLESSSAIRERLGISFSDIQRLSIDQVYGYWKTKLESDGVLVYESQYIPESSGVLGAAIFYDLYPIILVRRGGEANDRKLFTLLHEYAHLLLGESALNDAGAQTTTDTRTDRGRLEAFCNQIAGEVLVPTRSINESDYVELSSVAKMERLSGEYKVTYSTAAVRLRRMNLISAEELNDLLRQRYAAYQKKQSQERGETKIPRQILMKLDLGKPMFDAVLSAYSVGALDVLDASRLLHLRVNKIDKLLSGKSA